MSQDTEKHKPTSPSDLVTSPLAAAAAAAALRMPATANQFYPFAAAAAAVAAASSGGNPDPSTAALYQSPLWQAALRQQQLQLLSHMMNSPYLQQPQSASLIPPPHTTHSISDLALLTKTATSAGSRPHIPLTGDDPSSIPFSGLTADHYRNYLSKFVQLQQQSNSTSVLEGKNNKLLSSSTTSKELLNSNSNVRSQKESHNHRDRHNSSQSSANNSVKAETSNSALSIKDETLITGSHKSPIKSSSSPTNNLITSSSNSPKQRNFREFSNGNSTGNREKVFTCKICNRSFGYKHVLQNHERTHTGEKPFECKVCHKRFTRDHHLKTHMRLHTGEKPYSCTHCERQFVQVANLRRHIRVHTGEKPYRCELCDNCFSDSNQLKAHMLIHKGEKPFSCELCKGQFRRRHHLMHHACPKLEGKANSLTVSNFLMEEDEDDLKAERVSSSSLSPPGSVSDSEKRSKRKNKEPRKWHQPYLGEEEEEEDEDEHNDKKLDSFQTEPEDLSSVVKVKGENKTKMEHDGIIIKETG